MEDKLTVYWRKPKGMLRSSRLIFTKTVPKGEKWRVISASRPSSDFCWGKLCREMLVENGRTTREGNVMLITYFAMKTQLVWL